MTDYDNTNRGALFANKDRQTENHPNATGTLNVGGTEYWISAWTKTSKAGDKYQSLSVKPKEMRATKAGPIGNAPEKHEPEFDDSIPF